MNRHDRHIELPKLFPAVLDGSCPLGIFADAMSDCDLDVKADYVRRLFVLEVHSYTTPFRMDKLEHRWLVALQLEAAPSDEVKPAYVWAAQWCPVYLPGEDDRFDTPAGAELFMRLVAVRTCQGALGVWHESATHDAALKAWRDAVESARANRGLMDSTGKAANESVDDWRDRMWGSHPLHREEVDRIGRQMSGASEDR